MKCYYEELGVEREADDKEIKNAYRKLALRFHPDKNLDNAEEAKERFQLIQQAYEVLSDPQERAFYDKHREHILRGKNSNYEDNTLDLFQYFTRSCFQGYGDDVKGFYAVYREVFKKIVTEDAEFMGDDDELEDIPEFGDSQSTYEDVVGPFYAYWQSYCTKKTYTWLCPYDIQEVKDRRVLRAIEKEMKKVVQNAKRERNEEVRSLVSYVRKRDKRVQAYNRQLEERAAVNRMKQEQNRREQLLRRQRELEEMLAKSTEVYNEGYEEQLKQLEQEYGASSEASNYTDDEAIVSDEEVEGNEGGDAFEEFFCVACTKAFKNQNAFDNHALSKKHRENEERLKMEMLDEEDSFSRLKLNLGEEEDSIEDVEDEENLAATTEEASNIDLDDDEDLESKEEDEEDCDRKSNTRRNKKNKKFKKNSPRTIENSSDNECIDDIDSKAAKISDKDDDDDDDVDWNVGSKRNSRKNQNKKQSKESKKSKKKNISKIVDDSDEECLEDISIAPQKPNKDGDDVVVNDDDDKNDDWSIGNKKNNRKNQNKKNAKDNGKSKPTAENSPTKIESKQALEDLEPSSSTKHACATCNATFESKNKLFAHLKKTNHGVYIPKPNTQSNDSTKGKTKAKRK